MINVQRKMKQKIVEAKSEFEIELIKRIVSDCYKKYYDVFFKETSNMLLSFKKNIDHKIDLKLKTDSVKEIDYESLYKMSADESKVMK